MSTKIFTLLIVLYPILSGYSIYGPIDLGLAICVFVAGVLFTTGDSRKLKIPKGWIAFLLYISIDSIFITHSLPIRVYLYTFLLIMGCNFCNFILLVKYYKKTVIICIVFFLLQELIRVTMGIIVPGIFNILPTVYGDSSNYITNNILESTRCASFFLEPSYFAQYIFPLIVLELFWNKQKKHMRNAIILTIVTFLIRSGNGIMLLIIIWGLWILFSKVKNSTKFYIIISACVTLSALVAYNRELFTGLIVRTNELSISGSNELWLSSGFIRFWRGYFLYVSLPLINQFLGMNPIGIESYMLNNSLNLFTRDSSFLNGIQTILCYYGAIGLFFVLRHLYLLGKKSSIVSIVFIISIFYLLLSESYFITGRMLFVIILVFILNKQNNENSIYNQYISSRK